MNTRNLYRTCVVIAVLLGWIWLLAAPARADEQEEQRKQEEQKKRDQMTAFLHSDYLPLLGFACARQPELRPSDEAQGELFDLCKDPSNKRLEAFAQKAADVWRTAFREYMVSADPTSAIADPAPPSWNADVEVPAMDVSLSFADIFMAGLASFLVERAKIEIQRMALEKLATLVQCNDGESMRTWIPHLCRLVRDGNKVLTGSFAETVKSALLRDVYALPGGLLKLAKEEECEDAEADVCVRARLALALFTTLLETADPDAVAERLRGHLQCGSKAGHQTERWCKALGLAHDLFRYIDIADGRDSLLSDQFAIHLAREVHGIGDGQQTARLIALLRSMRRAWNGVRELAGSGLSDADRARRVVPVVELLINTFNSAYMIHAQGQVEPSSLLDGSVLALFDAAAREDLPAFLTAVLAHQDVLPGFIRVPQEALPLIILGAELANAKTKEDVTATLLAFSSKSSDTRAARGQVNIAGYFTFGGGTFGGLPRTANGDDDWTWGGELSPSALLGVEASWPRSEKNWTGVFLPAIDAMSSVSLRLGSELDSNPKSFIAPGIYWVYSLSGSFVVSAGASVLPFGAQRTENGEKHDVLIVRGMLSLGISLPIFELTSR